MNSILIVTSYYIPAVNAGGPIQSIQNFVEAIGQRANIFIFTRDRDLGDNEPFYKEGKKEWHEVGKSHVKYIKMGLSGIFKVLRESKVDYDVVYLNLK